MCVRKVSNHVRGQRFASRIFCQKRTFRQCDMRVDQHVRSVSIPPRKYQDCESIIGEDVCRYLAARTGPSVRRIGVKRRGCADWWAQWWASDDWRTAGMLHCNTLLLDIRILVRARELYTRGPPLTPRFAKLVTAKVNVDELDANPELA